MTPSTQISIPQGDTFDELRVPYVYYDDIGPIVAPPIAGCGDGKWVYDATLRIVETTDNPTRAQKKASARALRAQEARKFIMEWKDLGMIDNDLTIETDEDGEGRDDDDYIDFAKLAPPTKKKRVIPCTERLGEEEDILSRCEIIERTRASTGRVDLTIVTPDGHKFRSKSAAKQHMLESK